MPRVPSSCRRSAIPARQHAVGGAAPFEVVLGNAEAVTVTWRGVPFDTTPFMKQNVAKFTIK